MIEYKGSYGKKVKVNQNVYDDYNNLVDKNEVYIITQYKDREDEMVGIYPLSDLSDEEYIMSTQPVRHILSCEYLDYCDSSDSNSEKLKEIFEKNNKNNPLTAEQILEMTTNTIVEDIRAVQSQRDTALHQITQISKALSIEVNAFIIESYIKELNRHHLAFVKYNAELEKLKIYKFQMTGEI